MEISFDNIIAEPENDFSIHTNRKREDFRNTFENRIQFAISKYLDKNKLDTTSKDVRNLRETIESSIEHNNNQYWIPLRAIDITRTPEDMLELFKLRHEVYVPLEGYKEEFQESIPTLMFDEFDERSSIFNYKREHKITGSIRIVEDREGEKLPSENKFNLDKLRKKGRIAEFSRQVIKKDYQASGVEFRNFYAAGYNYAMLNQIDILYAAIDKDHLGLYKNFGGISIEGESKSYGNIQKPFVLTAWDVKNASMAFKKIFLRGENFL